MREVGSPGQGVPHGDHRLAASPTPILFYLFLLSFSLFIPCDPPLLIGPEAVSQPRSSQSEQVGDAEGEDATKHSTAFLKEATKFMFLGW